MKAKQIRPLKIKRVPPGKRVTRRQIAAVARHIAERFNPEKIILFGSYAYGKPTVESDVDFLVVMNKRLPSPKQEAQISLSFKPYPFPMDILVETPQRIDHRVSLGDPFLTEITERGKILYERNPARVG